MKTYTATAAKFGTAAKVFAGNLWDLSNMTAPAQVLQKSHDLSVMFSRFYSLVGFSPRWDPAVKDFKQRLCNNVYETYREGAEKKAEDYSTADTIDLLLDTTRACLTDHPGNDNLRRIYDAAEEIKTTHKAMGLEIQAYYDRTLRRGDSLGPILPIEVLTPVAPNELDAAKEKSQPNAKPDGLRLL